jgi:hypothetical protein
MESAAGYERASQAARAEQRRYDAKCEREQRAAAWQQRLREGCRGLLPQRRLR